MTILDLIQKTTAFFEKVGVPDPRLDVELLLTHVLELKRMDLYLQFERQLSEPELDRLRPLVKRRAAREPLQHILEKTEFCGLEIRCTPQALIPRPETELVVQRVIQLLANKSPAAILDVGTGSGAIALAVARASPSVAMVASDLSEDTLALARANAEKNGLQNRVEFRPGNLFEMIAPGEKFDLIVSNPPYIPSGEMAALQPEVRHDPPLSLDGGADGLDIIRKLIMQSANFLKEEGWLVFEIGQNQASGVRQLLEENGWIKIEIANDLRRIPRVVSAKVLKAKKA